MGLLQVLERVDAEEKFSDREEAHDAEEDSTDFISGYSMYK